MNEMGIVIVGEALCALGKVPQHGDRKLGECAPTQQALGSLQECRLRETGVHGTSIDTPYVEWGS